MADLIRTGGEKNLSSVWRCLYLVIRGAYDADKMDFLLRDAESCGLQGISRSEVDRLMITSFVDRLGDGSPAWFLDASSLPALAAFLRHRQHITEVSYFHRTVRSFEETVSVSLAWAMSNLVGGSPLDNLDNYLACDEYTLHAFLSRAASSTDPEASRMGKKWLLALQGKMDWDEACTFFRRSTRRPAPVDDHAPEDVKRKILEELKEDVVIWVDKPLLQAPGTLLGSGPETAVLSFDRKTGKVSSVTIEKLRDRGVLGHIAAFRVYVHRDYKAYLDKVVSAARKIFSEDQWAVSPADSDLTSW